MKDEKKAVAPSVSNELLDAVRMKNISELTPSCALQCPVEYLGAVWVQVIYFGKPTKRALDKTIEMLIEMRNGYDESI